MSRIILISGPLCSGKSSLAKQIAEKFNFTLVKTTEIIRARKKGKKDRPALIHYGDRLDTETNGKWILESLFKLREDQKDLVVDSARSQLQINCIRKVFGKSVIHIHLTAEVGERKARYCSKFAGRPEIDLFDAIQRKQPEKRILKLIDDADIAIYTDRCTEADILTRVACLLNLYEKKPVQLVDVIIGGQYGSEGKGNIASYISREYSYLVRVGGPNAGHTVYDDDGRKVKFRQIPSGSLIDTCKLVLGPGAIIDIQVLQKEIAEANIEVGRLFIDPQALIITPEDSRQEAGDLTNISTTGSGTGAALARRITDRGGEGTKTVKLARDFQELSPYIRKSTEIFEEAFFKNEKVLLEGTQGTGLSLYHGHYPHVTSRDTTAAGCLAEAGISPRHVRRVIMVCRTYPIRVANPKAEGKTSGYMSREIDFETISARSGLDVNIIKEIERTTVTNHQRRIAEFDWCLLKNSSALNCPSDIALTFVDYIDAKNQDARRFDQLTSGTIKFIEEIERVSSAPVSLISTRSNNRNIIDRRRW